MKIVKELLKQKAAEIRKEKFEVREVNSTLSKAAPCDSVSYDHKAWCDLSNRAFRLHCQRRDYRHMHIAYCLLRGKTYEQVEPKVREGNKPNSQLIETYLNEFRAMLEVKDAA